MSESDRFVLGMALLVGLIGGVLLETWRTARQLNRLEDGSQAIRVGAAHLLSCALTVALFAVPIRVLLR